MKSVFNPSMPGGNKSSKVLKETYSFSLQVCLSTYDLLLPPGIKGFTMSGRELHMCPKESKAFVSIFRFITIVYV